jgi:hypothetical protein
VPVYQDQTGRWWYLPDYTAITLPVWSNQPLTYTGTDVATVPLGAYQILTVPIAATTWSSNNALTSVLTQTSGTSANYGAQNYQQYLQAFDVPMPSAAERLRPRHPTQSPAIIRAGRRAVRRQIDLYLRFRPEEELKRFVAGQQIVIQGARCRYAVRKDIGIMRHSMLPHSAHTPYKLWLLGPSDRPLASGCVYLDETPVLDQLLAFIMHVTTDAETEREFLRRTNWSPGLPSSIWQRFFDPPLAEAAD